MNKLKTYSWIVVAGMAATTLFSACDKEEETDPYDRVLVYLQSDNYLQGEDVCRLEHNSVEGITGKIEIPFSVKVRGTSEEAITVELIATAEPESGLSDDDFVFSKRRLMIPAGESVGYDTLRVVDLSFLGTGEAEKKVGFSICLNTLECADSNVGISSQYNELPVTVLKEAYQVVGFLEMGEPENSHLMTNRQDWVIQIPDGVEGTPANLTDGSSSDVAQNNSGFWITIDLGKVTSVTGIRTDHWGPAYCPTEVELFTSEDGQQWRSLGVVETGQTTPQNIRFLEVVNTRYLKYDMLQTPSRVDVTEFNIYEQD